MLFILGLVALGSNEWVSVVTLVMQIADKKGLWKFGWRGSADPYFGGEGGLGYRWGIGYQWGIGIEAIF